MMTRKDFVQVAAAVADLVIHDYPLNDSRESQATRAAERVANYLALTNPRFDRERFVEYVVKSVTS